MKFTCFAHKAMLLALSCAALHGAPALAEGGDDDAVFRIVPNHFEYGSVIVGTISPSWHFQVMLMQGAGSVVGVTTSSGEFAITGGTCLSPMPHPMPEGGYCSIEAAFRPSSPGQRFGTLNIATESPPGSLVINLSGTGVVSDSMVQIVEYYNLDSGHYFITPNAGEILLLGKPPFADWQLSGYSFLGYSPAKAPAGTVPVCRFYNDHFEGLSSHFYAPKGLGCEDTIEYFPDWTLEDDRLFYAYLPDGQGLCPAGQMPVYRLFNNGAGGAPNHRFTTRADLRQQLIDGEGFTPEGAGIGVGWCAPQ